MPLINQSVIEPLEISLNVRMLRVFLHSVTEMLLSRRDDLDQILRLEGVCKSLRVGVQVWTFRGTLNGFGTRGFQDRTKRPGEQSVSIVNEKACLVQEPVVAVAEASCNLTHPLAIGSGKMTCDFRAADTRHSAN